MIAYHFDSLSLSHVVESDSFAVHPRPITVSGKSAPIVAPVVTHRTSSTVPRPSDGGRFDPVDTSDAIAISALLVDQPVDHPRDAREVYRGVVEGASECGTDRVAELVSHGSVPRDVQARQVRTQAVDQRLDVTGVHLQVTLGLLQRLQVGVELVRITRNGLDDGASNAAMITAGSSCASGSIAIGSTWFITCSTAMSTAASSRRFFSSSIPPAPAAVTGLVSIGIKINRAR